MAENQEGKVILEYGSKGFENEYSKLTKLSKLLRTFQNNYIKINHMINLYLLLTVPVLVVCPMASILWAVKRLL